MAVTKFKVINPTTDTKLPFFDEKKGIFYIPLKSSYRYFIEATNIAEDGDTEYYLLLGKAKFDNNCRLCSTDNYGRVQVKIKGELKDYIVREMAERGNIKVEYVQSDGEYDVFIID